MSVTSTGAVASRDPWQLRFAIAAYPEWWQDRYGDDAAATVADLTAARGSLPAGDLAGLLVRGLYLRARGSIVFWMGLTLIAVEIMFTASSYFGFRAELSWSNVLLHAGWSVMLAVPLVAGSAAWAAGARPRPAAVGARLATLGRSAAAVLGFAVVGYLTVVVLILINSGWPVASSFDLGYTAGFAAMTVSALAVGILLGSVLPRWLALPGGVGLGLLAMLSEGWQGGELRWRNVTGSALTFDADFGVAGTANLHVIAVTAGYAALLAIAAVAVVALRPFALRIAVVVTTFAVIVGGSVAISAPLLDYVGTRPATLRSSSELHCVGSKPRICLWPEQDASDGAQLRAILTDAYRRMAALGVPVTGTLSAGFFDHPETAPAIAVSSGTHLDRTAVITGFVSATIQHGACLNQPQRVDPDTQSAAVLGLASLLGTASDATLPRLVGITTLDPITGKPHVDSAAEIRDYYGIHNTTEAKAVVTKWFTERKVCAP